MTRSSLLAATALGATLAVGAVGLGAAVLPNVAGAQTAATTTATGAASDGSGSGRLAGHPRLRHLLREEGQVAADAIGVSRQDLRQALRSGQSVADVARAHGVDPQTVVEAVVADLDAKLTDAVQDGHLTQDRADRISDRLPTRIGNLVERHRPATAQG